MAEEDLRGEGVLQSEGALLEGGAEWIRFLSRLGLDPAADLAFPARNFLLDEGIPVLRVQSYGEAGAMGDHGSVENWQGIHGGYLAERVFRLPPGDGFPRSLDPADEISCPETFRFIDPETPFLPTDARMHLIRVERLDFVAKYANKEAAYLRRVAEAVLDSKDPAAGQQLNDILRTWEREADLRPVFSVFLEDVKGLFGESPGEDPPGWADDLRDSLGLFHYDPGDRNGALDILVFRFPVSAVPRLKGLGRDRRPLVPPTVLDNRPSSAFFPAPRASLTGHVIDLSAQAKSLRQEVLHPSVAFEAKHLFRVGTVIRPVDPSTLSVARGLHISMVRQASGRSDYAAGTDGDLL